MIVLDTHAWVWWTSDPSKLSTRAREVADGHDEIGICSISCWEVAMLVERGRLELDREIDEWVGAALSQSRVRELPLTAAVAVRAAVLEREGFPPDPADRIIYATTRSEAAVMVTKDRAIRSFDGERTLW